MGIPIRTSTDRTAWVDAGVVWPDGASWTDAYTGTSDGSLWAPDCTYLDGTFYVSLALHLSLLSRELITITNGAQLYYAASSFGSQNSAIFFAKSTTGAQGSWTNEGLVTSTATGATYNAIDPDLVIGACLSSCLGDWMTVFLTRVDTGRWEQLVARLRVVLDWYQTVSCASLISK